MQRGTPRPGYAVWLSQFHTLLLKNIAILRHKWLISLLIIALPALFVALLYWVYSALPGSTTPDVPLALRKCETFNVYGQVRRGSEACGGEGYVWRTVGALSASWPTAQADLQAPPCITVAFAPDTQETESIMKVVAKYGRVRPNTVLGGRIPNPASRLF